MTVHNSSDTSGFMHRATAHRQHGAIPDSDTGGAMRRPRFIIFSLSRCGSTTLMRALNCHPEIRCVDEPFNTYDLANTYAGISSAQALDAALQALCTRFNAIKHVWHHSGWPFPPNSGLNERLLTGPGCKVLFMWRRNILRRAVSSQIGKQTGIWYAEDGAQRSRLRHFAFAPLDLAWIEWHVQHERARIADWMQLLADSNVEWLDLRYEDLYDDGLTPRQRWQKLEDIIAFLGFSEITDPDAIEVARRILDPARTKLTSLEVYRRIPGIEEAERRFGSDETGWLLQ
jgi:Stf0 sulfotransferase